MNFTVTIPFKTPSINHLYGSRGFRRFLTKEATQLKKQIIDIVGGFKSNGSITLFPANTPIKLKVQIFEDWFYKNGEVAKKDISNREKFLIDSIFEALNLDDKYIFEHTLIKRQIELDQQEKSIVELETF
jgi:hypothetical protein